MNFTDPGIKMVGISANGYGVGWNLQLNNSFISVALIYASISMTKLIKELQKNQNNRREWKPSYFVLYVLLYVL